MTGARATAADHEAHEPVQFVPRIAKFAAETAGGRLGTSGAKDFGTHTAQQEPFLCEAAAFCPSPVRSIAAC